MSSPAFWQGIEEFNQRQFYACHDTLEAIWLEASELDKRFYQGVLQIAVACYHLGNYNWRGAVMLLGEGIRRLYDYQPSYHGIDVELLLHQSIQLLHNLQQLDPERAEEFYCQLAAKQQQSSERASAELANTLHSSNEREIDLTHGCQLPYILKVSDRAQG
ncbi:DUF309 domain-containing protein [Myxosarcina sp. GI1]|uniref:DUF309 domain-containing protein n=1 Tax=Myxosarcina sp. GI1 TaxID=1541065 RepID=UPI0005608C85|nr:DUF309 domain-containing protein [Myxosarcina sp. GI1]